MAYHSTFLTAYSFTVDTIATPLAGPTQPSIREILVQSEPTNAANMRVGSSTAQSIVLTPGQSISIKIRSIDLVYVRMVAGTGQVNVLAID